jgi:hypothetical protein
MKKLLIAVAFVGLALATLYPFRGLFPPFYYAQFNDVRNRLHEIEGLKIKDYWQHKDIRLEDCGFDVEIGGRQVSLTFSDHQDWVDLFDKFDGFYMSEPDQQIVFTKKQMNAAGLRINGLEDLLQNLDAVHAFILKDAEPKALSNDEYDYRNFLNYALLRF